MKPSILRGIFCVTMVSSVITIPAYANSITSWSCEAASGSQTLTLTTSSSMSSNAIVNINGSAQSGVTEVNGSSVSVAIGADIACWDSTFTITDQSDTFGSN